MWDTSLDLFCMVRCAIFVNVLENCCMQSATDDPGFYFLPPSTGHRKFHTFHLENI